MLAKSTFLIALWACTVSAQSTITNPQDSCPDGWSFSQLSSSDTVYCCPGASHIINDEGFCVIGSSSIPYTTAGYTSIVSSLAAEESGGVVMASTTISTNIGTSATASSETTADGSSAAMTGSSSGASGAAATSSSSQAGAAPTGLVGNAVVGAIGGALLYML